TLVRNAVEEAAYRWTTSMVLLVVLLLAWGGGTALRYAARGVQRERETGQQRLQELQVSLARELHDSVAQTLSSAAMRANIVMGDPTLSPLAVDQLERIADECRSSAHDLRQLLSALRDEPERAISPGPLADVESLRQAVAAQAERLRSEGFSVAVELDITKLSAARCQTLAAITVEAANNVLKHAKKGTRCTFSIVQGAEDVVGEFSNVRRDSKSVRQGFGLTGVQERLTLLDGSCSVILKGGRWVLQARLPLGVETNRSPSSASPVVPEPLFAEEATA
ncbi:MAG: histidine kinase, partial [Arachnia sp.]